VRADLGLSGNVIGAVFGWDEPVRDHLTKTQAENAMRVIESIQAARKASLIEN
jgi:hypothetical protein